MRGRSAVARVFALFAIMGVVLSPMARPVMAMPAAVHVAMDEHTATDAMAVAPDDMSCCPGKPSLSDYNKDCPLMALCGAMVLHGVSDTSLIVPLTLVAIILPGDPSALVSLADAPPRKP